MILYESNALTPEFSRSNPSVIVAVPPPVSELHAVIGRDSV